MKRLLTGSLFLALGVAACDAPEQTPTALDEAPSLTAALNGAGGNVVDAANVLLEAQGSEYRVAQAEYYTDPASGEMGNAIVASDRGNKRLAFDYIPDHPFRGGFDGDPNTIDFWVDLVDGATASGLDVATTTNAILRSTQTWDDVNCSGLEPNFVTVGADLGLVQWLFGFSANPGPIAVSDIMHAGWLPGAFFDLLRPGGSTSILGVTFTLFFASGDFDNDGRPDLGAREIYYNDNFSWADDGTSNFDVETVALHEAGHGLSQAHFGKIHIGQKNGKVHFSPRAVMNAVYSGPQRDLAGTDNGGHCASWGSWPNN